MKKSVFWTIIILAAIACLFLFRSIFLYGSPDSPVVNIVGKDLPYFTEYEKTEPVSISDIDASTIIYLKKTYNLYFEADKPGDETYLILKNLSGGSEKIIFQGNLGHQIDNLFYDGNNHRLLYTYEDIRYDYGRTYLIIFDLKTMREVNKFMMLDKDAYHNDEHFLGAGAYISDVLFEYDFGNVLYLVYYQSDSSSYNAEDYFSMNVNTGDIVGISEEKYEELLHNPDTNKNSFTYYGRDGEKHLFSIFPWSDYLPSNFKHKYNGIYIDDGTNSVRVSSADSVARGFESKPFWLEDGRYVVLGPYLYDTSGRKTEIQIADGIVLAMF